MKQTLCAAKKICGNYECSDCDGCEYGKIFVHQSRSMKTLRRKLQALQEERNYFRWHKPENKLPENDDVVLAIVSGHPLPSRPKACEDNIPDCIPLPSSHDRLGELAKKNTFRIGDRKMKCNKCPQYNQCDSPIKDLNHPDISCLRYNKIQLPALPGDDVYWIDEMCEGAPKIICDKGAVEAVCYYGNGVFKIKCKNDEPEDIGTKWCCLTYEQAEKVLEDLKK